MDNFVMYKDSVDGKKITINVNHIVAVIDDPKDSFVNVKTIDGNSYLVCRGYNQLSASEIYDRMFE